MRPELIIFDCDGVLIDSEGVASGVTARFCSALGWEMTADEALSRFLGMSILDIEPLVKAHIGRKVPDGWREGLARELVVALGREARLIPGARELLVRVNELGIPFRVASNSSDEEMKVKFAKTGLADLVEGRCFAAMKFGRPKPTPDVFLAAAGDVPADRCLVVEDSALGVKGAVAAGMVCYGFAPHGDGAGLLAAGAVGVFRELDELFGVVG
jgi:HAD superfamily hydrolase (TIGR01509 family)